MPDFKSIWQAAAKFVSKMGAKPGQLVFPVGVDLQCAKPVAKRLPVKRPQHLVIYVARIQLKCFQCGDFKPLDAVFARRFDCLALAETFRASVKRQIGSEARIVSSASVCAEYLRLAMAIQDSGPEPVMKYLADQYERAASPAHN